MRGVIPLLFWLALSVCAHPASCGAGSALDAELGKALAGENPTSEKRSSAHSGKDLYPEIRVRATSPRHTILSSQTVGIVNKVAVRDGDRFSRGQILLEIDPTFESIQLKKARANLRRHELLLRMTKQQVKLQTKGELELEMVKTDIMQAAAEVEFIAKRLERMKIQVPFQGRVGAVLVKELQFVAEGQPLLEVIDDADMELEFIVSSQWLRWFKPGLEFSVRIDETGKTYQAVLERLGGKVDPLSRSVNAYAKLTTPDTDLMEGMSGEAFILPPQTP